jgi:hypothetical protein
MLGFLTTNFPTLLKIKDFTQPSQVRHFPIFCVDCTRVLLGFGGLFLMSAGQSGKLMRPAGCGRAACNLCLLVPFQSLKTKSSPNFRNERLWGIFT